YGFQSDGLEEGQTPLTTIESMAASYIKEMRSLQPEGPYQITGLSMGAVVAFEMAQQLKQMNESVSLLALLDGGCEDNPTPFLSADYEERLERAQRRYILMESSRQLQIPTEETAALDPDLQLVRFL